jgi:D-alanyl-D-alanine carboxypeptidase (penicillin-binding protein 5/6)
VHRRNQAWSSVEESAGKVLALFIVLVLLAAMAALATGVMAPLVPARTSIVDAPCATPYVNPSPYDELVYHRKYAEGPNVSARAAILVEASTGTILYARNEHEIREPASITKIMTAIVAIERGDLADIVKISAGAARVGGSSLGLAAGQRYKLEELIRATMLRSGNDGATAVAEHVGGSVAGFVELMNARAASMGLKHTRFANPHGLSAPGHHSTAYDIALMCVWGFRLRKFADIVGCPELWSSPLAGGQGRLAYNTNRLLWSLAGADGVKTGTTTRAGHCLAASATRDGLQFIAVVLRSGARFHDASALLEYGFANFVRVDMAKAGQPVADALAGPRGAATAGLATARDVSVVVRRDELDQLDAQVIVAERLKAKTKAGKHSGWLRVLFDDEEVGAYPLYTVEGPKKRG